MAALRVSRPLKPFSLVHGHIEMWALAVLRVTVCSLLLINCCFQVMEVSRL